MQSTGKPWIAAGVGVVILFAAVASWQLYQKAISLSISTSAPSATSTAAVLVSSAATTTPASELTLYSFPIHASDRIASWDFRGAYAGNAALTAQATADITHLKSLLGNGEYDDYDLYIGIGNDDNLLGNGKGAYQNFNRSISIHPKKALAYANLAHLMDELGAYRTAADAYEKAVAVEPSMLEYHVERLTYLTRQFPNDSATVLAAFADASKQFGDTAPILAIEAQWLAGQKRYADAISAWERVKLLSLGRDTSAIDAEIARLKTKQ